MELTIYTAMPKIADECNITTQYFAVASLNVSDITHVQIPTTHIIFTIDISISMDEPTTINSDRTKLQDVVATIRGCLNYIRASPLKVFVSVLTFTDVATTMLSAHSSTEITDSLINELEQNIMDARRSQTNIQAALEEAVKQCDKLDNALNEAPISHVNIILTDGYVNMGFDTSESLATIINTRCEHICHFIGVGEDHDYILLRDIARKTDGTNDFLETIENADILYADLLSPYLRPCVTNIRFRSKVKDSIMFLNQDTGETDSDEFIIRRVPCGDIKHIHMLTTDPACIDLMVTYDTLRTNGTIETNTLCISQVRYEGDNGLNVCVFGLRMRVLELLAKASRLLEKEKETNDGMMTPPPLLRTDRSISRSLLESITTTNQFECLKREMKNLSDEIDELKNDANTPFPVFYEGLCDMLMADLNFGQLALSRVDNPEVALMVTHSRFSSQMWQKAYSIQNTVCLADRWNDIYDNVNGNQYQPMDNGNLLITQEQIYNIYTSAGTIEAFNSISSSAMYG